VSTVRRAPLRTGAVLGTALTSSFLLSEPAQCEESTFATKLDPANFQKFRVALSEFITHDSKLLIVDMPEQQKTDVSNYMLFKVPNCIDEKGNPFVRPYTPLDSNVKDGKMVFGVKGYEKGNLSKCLVDLKEGDAIEIKGPMPKWKYTANKAKNLVLVAGGSGLTPMLQIVLEVLSNPEDKTQMTLVYANHRQKDIMLESLLSHLSASEQLTVHHVLSTPDAGWKGHSGRVTQALAESIIPAAKTDTFVLVCGPPGFYETVSGPKGPNFTQGDVGGILGAMGYTSDKVFKI